MPDILNEKEQEVVEKTQVIVGHRFSNVGLLVEALSHSSYSNESSTAGRCSVPRNNERLEFLGDAVIGLVVAQKLMERFPSAQEGLLSRWRSGLVSRKTLAELAAKLNLGDQLFLGRGERHTGGAEKRSILAGVFESLVGALYLDADLERVSEYLEKVYDGYFEKLAVGDVDEIRDSKTELQELIQGRFRQTPAYRVAETWGAEHEKSFRVEIQLEGRVIGQGEGRSKKEAEQSAARDAIIHLQQGEK
jgi:ribonuclease-3